MPRQPSTPRREKSPEELNEESRFDLKSMHTNALVKSDPLMSIIMEIDELQSHPARFFNVLRDVVAEHADRSNLARYYYLLDGCSKWLSATEHGLGMELDKFAELKVVKK